MAAPAPASISKVSAICVAMSVCATLRPLTPLVVLRVFDWHDLTDLGPRQLQRRPQTEQDP